jgi:transposase
MGIREAVRLVAVREAVAGRISIREGVRRTGLSRRQFMRYKRRYREQGPCGLLHGNRGRPSARRISDEIREHLIALLQGEVVLNDCHVRDLLLADQVRVSADTVRRVRQALGQPPKQRRRPRQYRRRREREAQVGAMVLVDGSEFRWLGMEAPAATLIGALDDASGAIVALTFRPHEDLHGYTEVLRRIVSECGVPWTLYGDRAATLVRNDRHWTIEEELRGRQHPTQFGAMLEELGIRFIAALSPQAKGRIERLWRTLQDRLTAELQLATVRTLDAAEAFLPGFIQRFNARFGQLPRTAHVAWRSAPRDLDRILACRYQRTVSLDHTVSIPGTEIALAAGPRGRSFARSRVEVRELLDGRLFVLYQRRVIHEQPAPAGAFVLVPRRSTRDRLPRPVLARDRRRAARRLKAMRRTTPEQLVLSQRARKPASAHAWRKGYDPNLLPRAGTKAVSQSLRR